MIRKAKLQHYGVVTFKIYSIVGDHLISLQNLLMSQIFRMIVFI